MKARGVWCAALALAAACMCACGNSGAVSAQSTTRDRAREPARSAPRNRPRTLDGLASYYSDALAGRKTASGERYDPTQRTAASRTLPFGTMVRVTCRETGAQVVVRINDRGPFGDRRRILDLSRAAARELGILGRGVAQVRAEILELGGTTTAPAKQKKARDRAR